MVRVFTVVYYMKLFTELVKTLEEVKFPNLIDIGTCRVHVKHDAL